MEQLPVKNGLEERLSSLNLITLRTGIKTKVHTESEFTLELIIMQS